METDIEIAKNTKLLPIERVAKKLGLEKTKIEKYGNYKAKINPQDNPRGKIILVTAINPTAAGEGKTTVSIGLADALSLLGKGVCLALREPSLGPVFGLKGGATGGGYTQIAPMVDINLHFNGDMHAITAANNLICAAIDNHIYFGNSLKINKDKIYFNRCMDMNDRALRDITINADECSRSECFNITAASEIMAIFCLARDIKDLKRRIGNIVVAESKNGKFIYARDLKCVGAVCALLKEAFKPNLVQTLQGTPAIVHGGPFANIAHGCNSIIGTKTALSLADYVVTEAGFGADLGAQKFLDTKCRVAGIEPDAVVLVATIRALKLHGGADKKNLDTENLSALEAGLANLMHHINVIKNTYKKPLVVAINKFGTDTDKELNFLKQAIQKTGASVAVSEGFTKGGKGAIELAQTVLAESEKRSKLHYSYKLTDDIKTKIEKIVKNVYGDVGVDFSDTALQKIEKYQSLGYGKLNVIIAKTQYSLTGDKNVLGAPTGFKLNIRDVELRAGAEFIVAIAGDVLLMPGLPRVPALEKISIDDCGDINGIF